MRETPLPSVPSDPRHGLGSADRIGWAFVGWALVSTTLGWWLATHSAIVGWATGQVVLAAAFLQWFTLLHECGHGTLFRARQLNTTAGHVAGFFALIPFRCWTLIHARHHKWTGWQDKDPTTVALVPRPLGGVERCVINVCWRYWIPLFSVLYRLTNFWNLPRLRRLFRSKPGANRALTIDTVAMGAAYLTLLIVAGPTALIRTAGLALVLAFVVEDILLLSQHTHMPMGVSDGRDVEPYGALAQAPFTRSLRLPRWLSRMLLHFDAHELHHIFPAVPGYRLRQIPYTPQNEVSWREWVPAARAMPGDVFLFQNRNQSGLDV